MTADPTSTPPVNDPRLGALARQPWFADAYEAIHQAVQTLQKHGFVGTINVPGGKLDVR